MSDRPQNLDRPDWASQRVRPALHSGHADTPRPSHIHCDGCGRVFANGFVPASTIDPESGYLVKICRDCREDREAEQLF